MKILYIFATLPIGGAEEHLKTIVTGLDPKRFTPVVCTIGEKGRIGEEIESLGFTVVSLGKMQKKSWDRSIIKDIVKLIKEYDIDILHTHLYHANTYGRMAASKTNTPVVITEHNVYRTYKLKRKVMNRFLAKKTDKIIAVSGAVRDEIIGRDSLDPDLVRVVYNGIECDRFVPPTEDDRARARKLLNIEEGIPLAGTVCRLSKQKGHTYLFKAFKEVLKDIPDARLVVVGSGPLEDELKGEVASLELTESVEFLGARRDVPELLKAFDLYVLPSLWEGLPIAMLEAFASGLPILATRVGGVGELVRDGESGYLIEPEDVEALTLKLKALLGDIDKARAFGACGRRIVEKRFSSTQMIDELTGIYAEAITKRKQ